LLITSSKDLSKLTQKRSFRISLFRLLLIRRVPGRITARSDGHHQRISSSSELNQGKIPLL